MDVNATVTSSTGRAYLVTDQGELHKIEPGKQVYIEQSDGSYALYATITAALVRMREILGVEA